MMSMWTRSPESDLEFGDEFQTFLSRILQKKKNRWSWIDLFENQISYWRDDSCQFLFFSFVMICGSRNHPKEDGSKKQTFVDSKINSQKIANRTLFLKGHDVHGAYCPSFVTRQTLERSAPISHEAVQVRVLSGWGAHNRVWSLHSLWHCLERRSIRIKEHSSPFFGPAWRGISSELSVIVMVVERQPQDTRW